MMRQVDPALATVMRIMPHMTGAKSRAVACVRDLRSVPPEDYRLPTDGRKWRRLCDARRALAMQLASYADGDGSRITVGVERICRELGWSNGWAFRILADLRKLKLLEKEGLVGEHGTARRRLNVPSFRQNSTVREQNSTIHGDQDSIIEGQNSTLRLEATVTTPSNAKPPLPPARAGGSTKKIIRWCWEIIEVEMGRHHRLPSLRAFTGAMAPDVVVYLNRKGFPARIVAPSE